jgi:hypothetical protein
MTGKWAAVMALALLAAIVPANAYADPPVLDSVTVPPGGVRPTLTWELPDGVQSLFMEASTSPVVNGDGYLGGRTNVSFDVLDPGQTTFTDDHDYPPGTYYAHVAGHDERCIAGACPLVEFSDVVEFHVPGRAGPTLATVVQNGDRLTASWALPAGYESDLIEVSRSPDTYLDGELEGEFIYENLAFWDVPDPEATSYESPNPIAPGTYYVHVAALDTAKCAGPESLECVDEFSEVLPVTMQAPPPPLPPPPPPPPADKVTSFSALKCASTQKAGNLLVQAGMAENGTITVSGALSVPNASKVFKLKSVSVTATAGKTVTVKVKLPKKALKAAKKALKRHKKVKASLTIAARDAAGNVKTEKRSVKLKR